MCITESLGCTPKTNTTLLINYVPIENKIDNQRGPTVEHRELCSIFCNKLNGKRICKTVDRYMYLCVYIYI